MPRTSISGVATLMLIVSTVHAFQGGAVLLDKKDKLTPKDPVYRPNLHALGPKIKKNEVAGALLKAIDGNPHKVYTLRLKKGEKVIIQQKSKDFDSVVVIETVGRTILDVNDDDPAGGTVDSYLDFTAPGSADYRVIATSLNKNPNGDYQLLVTRAK